MKGSKQPIDVVIYSTVPHRIEGTVYLVRGTRLTDMLSHTSQKTDFIPVTTCKIYDENGKLIYSTDFLCINRRHVTMIFEHPAEIPGN